MVFKAPDGLNEYIAEYLSRKIIRGELKPKQRIKEAKIAQELRVSRGPIREAFHILERKSLVKRLPRRGARVTDISRSYIDSLYDILIELYALAARKAAENRTKQDLVHIHRALKKIRQCAAKGDVIGYYDAIFQFSAVGVAAGKSPLLVQMLANLEPITRRSQFASLSRRAGDLKKNVTFFEDAVKYVEERDAEGCSETIRAYAQNEKNFALSAFKNKKLNSVSNDLDE